MPAKAAGEPAGMCLQAYSAVSCTYSSMVGRGLKTIGGNDVYVDEGADVVQKQATLRRASSLTKVSGAGPAGSPSITANGLMSLAILMASARDASSLVAGPEALKSTNVTCRPYVSKCMLP